MFDKLLRELNRLDDWVRVGDGIQRELGRMHSLPQTTPSPRVPRMLNPRAPSLFTNPGRLSGVGASGRALILR